MHISPGGPPQKSDVLAIIQREIEEGEREEVGGVKKPKPKENIPAKDMAGMEWNWNAIYFALKTRTESVEYELSCMGLKILHV